MLNMHNICYLGLVHGLRKCSLPITVWKWIHFRNTTVPCCHVPCHVHNTNCYMGLNFCRMRKELFCSSSHWNIRGIWARGHILHQGAGLQDQDRDRGATLPAVSDAGYCGGGPEEQHGCCEGYLYTTPFNTLLIVFLDLQFPNCENHKSSVKIN